MIRTCEIMLLTCEDIDDLFDVVEGRKTMNEIRPKLEERKRKIEDMKGR